MVYFSPILKKKPSNSTNFIIEERNHENTQETSNINTNIQVDLLMKESSSDEDSIIIPDIN